MKVCSPEKEIRIVEELITQRVDTIAVGPYSPESLQSGIPKAREAGIVPMTLEATALNTTETCIELCDSAARGETMAEKPPLRVEKVRATKK
jgi:simple sugar transport system substrate-binding protein